MDESLKKVVNQEELLVLATVSEYCFPQGLGEGIFAALGFEGAA